MQSERNFAGEVYQKKKFPIWIVAIAAMLVLIFACAIATGYFIIKGKDIQAKPASPIIPSEQMTASGVKLANDDVPGFYPQKIRTAEIKGVGTKVSVIESLRKNTDSSMGMLNQETDENGCVYYMLDEQILRIDIPMGVNDFKYNRSYYFNNGIFYFASIYAGAKQNSLYFHDSTMFRYINEGGKAWDNEFSNKGYVTVGNFALNEAYAFHDYKTGVQSQF